MDAEELAQTVENLAPDISRAVGLLRLKDPMAWDILADCGRELTEMATAFGAKQTEGAASR